ncbi:uncharacterized protein PHACADRAFT_262335, partial [Phanerochaete carnosa HHB-10118-sp]
MQEGVQTASTSRNPPPPVGQDVAHPAHAQVPDIFAQNLLSPAFDARNPFDISMFGDSVGDLGNMDFASDFSEWFNDPSIISNV